MSFFDTHDPLAVSIGIRLMRTLPRIEKLAQIKNSEMFRKRMMDVVDTGHTAWPAASPTLLKETKRIVRRKLKEAVDGGDVRELRIQAEELYRLDETLFQLELEQKKDRRPGEWKETIRKQFVTDLLDAVEAAGGSLVIIPRKAEEKLEGKPKHNGGAPHFYDGVPDLANAHREISLRPTRQADALVQPCPGYYSRQQA